MQGEWKKLAQASERARPGKRAQHLCALASAVKSAESLFLFPPSRRAHASAAPTTTAPTTTLLLSSARRRRRSRSPASPSAANLNFRGGAGKSSTNKRVHLPLRKRLYFQISNAPAQELASDDDAERRGSNRLRANSRRRRRRSSSSSEPVWASAALPRSPPPPTSRKPALTQAGRLPARPGGQVSSARRATNEGMTVRAWPPSPPPPRMLAAAFACTFGIFARREHSFLSGER